MNLNQSLIGRRGAKHGFGFTGRTKRHVMGPPERAPLRAKNTQKSSSSASSTTNWGKTCYSVLNSSTLRSGSTTVSSETESRVILALTEGRGDARCEVGLASIDLSLPTLILCQISDYQSYINTLTKINILNPTDIIVPATFLESDNRLINKIRQKFPNVKILGVPRKTFNKSNGVDRILQLCLPTINTICLGLQHKYYALAAAAALTFYLQGNLNIYYAKESLNVLYQESEGYAIIDVSTADRLELVSSTKPAQSSRYSTLFGVLNHCVTKVGARLLRSTILQPPSAPRIIETTSQCVSELIKHPEKLTSVQVILQKVSNIDQLLTLTSITMAAKDNCSVRQLNYLLLLNSLTELIEPLKDAVEGLEQPFFKALKQTLESENFGIIRGKIRTMIHPSAFYAKGAAGVTQRCFAIRSNVNGLLDLVRKTYSERLNDLTEYVRHLGNKYNLPLTLGNNSVKGYHIVMKLSKQQKRTFKKSDLPPEFIQVYRLAASFTMKTPELINYSTRLDDIMLEILKISNSMIYDLTVDLKKYMGFFYKLCEDVARLDMLQSLAEASRRRGYIRPKWGLFTEVINSRHPMLELLIGERRVPNPISICQDFNVQIITGPNGSGKSVYIRQMMLLQVMAQVGCYVPAESAIFRPMTRMFARIYLEDDLEYGASSFILEMKEVKYMMTLISEDTLFIIDELCRSTAADEGAAIAMAICEKFCTTKVFLYVTTHYRSLANLANKYLNVKTWHMETIATGDTPQDLTLDFKFRLTPGVTNLKQYGVYIVKKIWPQEILDDVYRILAGFQKKSVITECDGGNEAIRLKYKLESDFRKLKSLGKLTTATINKLLNDYQNELQKMNILINLSERIQNGDDQNCEEAGQEGVSASEGSTYQNISNFLQEDSDNINKLIPEVSLASSEREIRFEEDLSQSATQANENCDILIFTPKENVKNSIFAGSNIQNLSDAEMKEVADILESASTSFLEDDPEDFDFSQASSFKTASPNTNTEKNNSDSLQQEHIFPVVNVVEGPPWSQSSSSCSQYIDAESHKSHSFSYSPLCSQVSATEKEVGKSTNLQTSTSSSLRFLAKSDAAIITDQVLTSDTNLESSAPLGENVTHEISKSASGDANHKTSSSSSLKESDKERDTKKRPKKGENEGVNKNKRRPKKFEAPRKLTRREIQEEFDEQDRRLYESNLTESDLSKYLAQRLNRPSVRQVQNSKHVALVRRTDSGVEVIPAIPEPVKKSAFRRNLSSGSNNIDMTIFSDKNAERFDEFLNSEERDVKKFKFNFEATSQKSQEFHFNPPTVSDYAAGVENGSFLFRSQNSVVPNDNSNDQFHSLSSITPSGYYKDNRDDINDILNKYLGEREFCNQSANIFETCSLNDNDLNL